MLALAAEEPASRTATPDIEIAPFGGNTSSVGVDSRSVIDRSGNSSGGSGSNVVLLITVVILKTITTCRRYKVVLPGSETAVVDQ